MRRAIAAAVMGGLVLGGAVATPSVAAARGGGRGPGKAHPAALAKPRAGSKSTTAMKTVVYGGYEFQVPASWPVYRLDEYPQTCVRYDVHAVYLGTPGPDMRCTAGLVGRTQTVSFIPGKDATAGPGAGSPGHSAAPEEAGSTELQRLPAVHGTITQNAVQHKLEASLAAATPGATVLGTYGTDPAVVEQVLNTLHLAPADAAPTAQSASVPSQPGGTTPAISRRAGLAPRATQRAPAVPAPDAATPPARTPAKTAPAQTTPNPTYTSWRGVPAHWPVEIVLPSVPPRQPKPQPEPVHSVGGFDTCTAPSTSTMDAWRSRYSAVGVYIGGANAACAHGNLSAGWVQAVASMGWSVLPAYVGPQAPCWGGRGVLIHSGSAAAEGAAAAADAISDAHALGLTAGSPIYYDMEAYSGGTSCTDAVLEFLGAWDRQLRAAGYLAGVYSSQDSGISDMQTVAVSKTLGFTPPDAIWIALWDNVASLVDGTLAWPPSDRSKQYEGNVNETVGGVTLNIDKDIVGGPVAHLLRRILRHG
jgi:hypothetical protein